MLGGGRSGAAIVDRLLNPLIARWSHGTIPFVLASIHSHLGVILIFSINRSLVAKPLRQVWPSPITRR